MRYGGESLAKRTGVKHRRAAAFTAVDRTLSAISSALHLDETYRRISSETELSHIECFFGI